MKPLTERQRNTYRKKIYKVLTEQNFIIGEKEEKIIEERISNGRRYFFMVGKRKEDGKSIDRFIKIPVNNTEKLLLPFKRQIEFAKYVKEKRIINTRGVVEYNYHPKKGIPFAVMETFLIGHSKIGFIENNDGTEFLTKKEASRVMEQLNKFHAININEVPLELKKNLKKYKDDYISFEKDILKGLHKKVVPLDAKNKKPESTYIVLERRLGIQNLKEKLKKVLKSLKPIIDTKENKCITLVHGDMAPNNLYVFDSGDVELLDLEWVGICSNKAIAVIRDFGNLHARSWGNDVFRKALEHTLLKEYSDMEKEELGKAILTLSILRSHIHISGFFENYPWEKQKDPEQTIRRNTTEQDILGVSELLG